MAEHECTCTNCGGRDHCKIKFEPSRKCCCFWKPELKPIWISVEDALPEQSGIYLAYFTFKDGTHATDIAYINAGCHLGSITHWMPLPEPPEKE